MKTVTEYLQSNTAACDVSVCEVMSDTCTPSLDRERLHRPNGDRGFRWSSTDGWGTSLRHQHKSREIHASDIYYHNEQPDPRWLSAVRIRPPLERHWFRRSQTVQMNIFVHMYQHIQTFTYSTTNWTEKSFQETEALYSQLQIWTLRNLPTTWWDIIR